MKKKSAAFFSLLLAFSLLAAPRILAADANASVFLDGTALNSQALVTGETVSLPVRSLCEALGYTVAWQKEDGVQSVLVQRDGDRVVLDLTNQQIEDNGHRYAALGTSGTGIRMTGGRTYLDSVLFGPLFGVSSAYDAGEKQVSVRRIAENDLTVNTERLASDEGYLKLTIQYPRISGLSDSSVQDSINAVLSQAALNAQAEGKKNADDMAQWIAEGYTGGVTQCETYFDYMVQYNQNGLLSIVLKDYQYAGGAHGSTVQSSYTFDLSTGKALSLSDLMDGSVGYTAYLNSVIRAEIDRRVQSGNLVEFESGPFTDLGANPEYYLSNEGLVFYFQQYAYFPYAAGIQEFTVPYGSVKTMLKPAYAFLYGEPVALAAGEASRLTVGQIGRVTLRGNPTTGYSWHYENSAGTVLLPVSSGYTPDGGTGVTGAGGTYTWDFRALQPGGAALTFRYYRDWEGPQAAAQTVRYPVTVS